MERKVKTIKVSKKEFELYQWLEKGSDIWIDAYYEYEGRKDNGLAHNMKKYSSWFNRALKGLKAKGLCGHVPFVTGLWAWRNPGFNGIGDELKAEVIQLTDGERYLETNRRIL